MLAGPFLSKTSIYFNSVVVISFSLPALSQGDIEYQPNDHSMSL